MRPCVSSQLEVIWRVDSGFATVVVVIIVGVVSRGICVGVLVNAWQRLRKAVWRLFVRKICDSDGVDMTG